MKYSAILLLCAAAAYAERKPLPNQAGNEDIELAGTVLTDPQEIQQAVGAALGPGYVVVRLKATPKNENGLRVSPDDFTLLSRKDGQRCPALSPGEIAGQAALVVKPAAEQPGGDGTRTNGPIWAGVSTQIGKGGSANEPLRAALEGKILPDKETKSAVEGLLYFAIDGKVKPKDLSLLYKGRAGRLVMDFR